MEFKTLAWRSNFLPQAKRFVWYLEFRIYTTVGKIRIKTIGVPKVEEAQKEEARRRREAKKVQKIKKKVRAPGLKGGERVVAVGPTPEELEAMEQLPSPQPEEVLKQPKIPAKPKRAHSKRYQKAARLIDKKKLYPIKEAVSLLRKVSLTSFNGSVEAHINVKEKALSGEVVLPHGTGKKIKVAIADDKILTQIAKGKIDFDVLLTTPKMMPKLAKFGRLLGPRGLMPNPKTGTISEEPEKKAAEITRGKIQFKTEKDAPIIHLSFGKMDFKDQQLIENFKTLVAAIKPKNIQRVVVKSTMSPGIKVEFDKN